MLVSCASSAPMRAPTATTPIVDPAAPELGPPATGRPEAYPEPPDDPPPAADGERPRAHAAVDALLAAIEGAVAIDIVDEWGGLGTPYRLVMHLERRADAMQYRAEMGRLGRPPVVRKSGVVPFAIIEPFLHRLSQRRVDRYQDYATGPITTDDNPTIFVTVTGPSLDAPLRLSLDDNQRHWRANGLFVSPDPPHAGDPPDDRTKRRARHAHVNQSYVRMLTVLGAYEWLDEVSKSR
jgi:hypothetical protein